MMVCCCLFSRRSNRSAEIIMRQSLNLPIPHVVALFAATLDLRSSPFRHFNAANANERDHYFDVRGELGVSARCKRKSVPNKSDFTSVILRRESFISLSRFAFGGCGSFISLLTSCVLAGNDGETAEKRTAKTSCSLEMYKFPREKTKRCVAASSRSVSFVRRAFSPRRLPFALHSTQRLHPRTASARSAAVSALLGNCSIVSLRTELVHPFVSFVIQKRRHGEM